MNNQKSVFVTGAAAGIGRATALSFAKMGYTIGAYDIDEVGLKSLADEVDRLGAKVITGHLDVTDADEMAQRVGEFAQGAGGRLDVMVNNAGVLLSGRFEDIAVRAHHAEIDVNTKGVVNGLHAAFPHLRSTPGAVVVNLASASAIYGQAELANYSATKFFIRAITEALDLEWRRYGIRVVDMWPLLRENRDDEGRQDRHHRLAGHPADRAGRRRRHPRGSRPVVAAAAAAPGALPGGPAGQDLRDGCAVLAGLVVAIGEQAPRARLT